MEKLILFRTISDSKCQVTNLLQEYPGLQIVSEQSNKLVIAGTVHVARIFDDFPVVMDVELEITIPIGQRGWPTVKDIGGAIDAKYPHLYPDGTLCLATEIDFSLHFADGFDIVRWMEDFVEPYYFSHEYYQRYGCYPFGDRAHGFCGVIQSYCDVFSMPKFDQVLQILIGIMNSISYRGHHPCFCGSGRRMRDCHGQQIFPFYQHPHLRSQLIQDVDYLRKELEEFDYGENSCSSK